MNRRKGIMPTEAHTFVEKVILYIFLAGLGAGWILLLDWAWRVA